MNLVGRAMALKKPMVLSVIVMVVLIPLTLFLGITLGNDRKYYIVSTLILVYSILPFLLVFEKKRPQLREIMVIAVLSAIAVAGRLAFAWIPQFKPLVAIVIISGGCLGPHAGFLVGAMSAFVSNFYFSQGPWTPWQMFAFGIIGFFAGLIFSKQLKVKPHRAIAVLTACILGFFIGMVPYFIADSILYLIKKTTRTEVITLSFAIAIVLGLVSAVVCGIKAFNKTPDLKWFIMLYGGLATFFIGGFLLNLASAIMWNPNPTKAYLISTFVSGIPFDLGHAAATVFFLFFLTKPMIEKLTRIKTKYQLIER